MPPAPEGVVYYDTIGTMDKGINQGVSPNLLKNNQLANGTNVTVRGDYVNNRPPIVQIPFTFPDPTIIPLLSGYYQGGCAYLPDFGSSSLMAAISGSLLQFEISGNVCTVTNESIPGNLNTAAPTQSWLWQSENYVIVNDGQNLPLFFNGGSTVRSNGPEISFGNVVNNFTVPAVGAQVANVTLVAPGYTGAVGTNILVDNQLYEVVNSSGSQIILTNLSDTPGKVIPAATQVLSEPSVWGVLAAAHTFPNTTIPPNSQAAILTLTIGTKPKVGQKVFIIIPLVVHSVSGQTATLFTQSQSLNPGGLTLNKYQVINFAANNQPNVTVAATSAPFTVPAIGTFITVPSSQYSGPAGSTVYIGNGQYFIGAGATSQGGTVLTLQNIGDNPGTLANTRGPTGSVGPGLVTTLPQLPAGRMGAYIQGRNWMILTDSHSYIAGDIVGGTSGTAANNFRDAVLCITENTFLFEGGVFVVPGSGQQISAVVDAATLDASLGQGPGQSGTPTKFFSNNAPVDRSTWQSLTYPIQTESLLSAGPLGQYSTVAVNGDIWFRAPNGWYSLILARREFSTWGNVPQSREVQITLSLDNMAFLNWGSAVPFDNRVLMTANPTPSALGVYHPVTIARNDDPISNLTEKQPSVYDGIWTGSGTNSNLNVLQWITGVFDGVQRCFAFCANLTTNAIELWEILSDAASLAAGIVTDNGIAPIVMDFETASLMDNLANKTDKDFCRLADGEMAVDEVGGPCTFQVFYKPDQFAQWVPWYAWSVDGTSSFYPRMGFGEPAGTAYDTNLNRPTRNGFMFQIRFVITGPCRFLGARFKAVPEPQPDFAPQLPPSIAFSANPNIP